MRKRRIIILATAVVAVLGLIWLALSPRPPTVPDPVYDGHPLSFWLDPSSGTNTKVRFPSLDSNAIPYLIQTLKKHDGAMRKAYDRLWPQLPGWLKGHLPTPFTSNKIFLVSAGDAWREEYMIFPKSGPRSSAGERVNSCYCLGAMGAGARPAIPDLIHLAREDDEGEVRVTAVWALANMARADDKSAVEALMTVATKDKYSYVRKVALWGLARIAPEAAARAGVTNAAAGASPTTTPAGAVR